MHIYQTDVITPNDQKIEDTSLRNTNIHIYFFHLSKKKRAAEVTAGIMMIRKLSLFILPIVQNKSGNMIGLQINHLQSNWSTINSSAIQLAYVP